MTLPVTCTVHYNYEVGIYRDFRSFDSSNVVWSRRHLNAKVDEAGLLSVNWIHGNIV